MATDVLALVNYYCRAGYYRHAQTVCNEVLKTRSNDVTMLFWRAAAMLKEGQAAEAVRGAWRHAVVLPSLHLPLLLLLHNRREQAHLQCVRAVRAGARARAVAVGGGGGDGR